MLESLQGGTSTALGRGMRRTHLLVLAYSALMFSACGGGAHSDFEGSYGGSDGGGASGSDEQGEPNEGDNFEPVGTNPFTMVAYDPLSTFAADVDTASYDIFVRDIEAGILPQPESVRLEEYVNSFRYDYEAPAADAAHPFRLHLDAAPSILGQTTVLRVGLQAKVPPAEEKRPTNLVFLVDISGSMSSATKLPLVKQVLLETLDLLDPNDTVSIVTYAGATGVALAPTPISERTQIENVIASFNSGGSTAGAAGIDLAYQQAESAFLEGGVNHVLLCTDGDFNVGPSSTAALVDLIEVKRESGVTLTVLGFGVGNLNDAMMELISNKGNGIYGVISSAETASRYVEERMLSSFNLIAKDLKLQIEFNPDHVTAYRLLGYENRSIADDDFREDSIDAGEVGAGHQVTALYELILSGQEIPSSELAPEVEDGKPYQGPREVSASDLAMVKIRYKEPNASSGDDAMEVSTSLAPESVASSLEDAHPDLLWAVSIAAFAEVLKNSPYAKYEAIPLIGDYVNAGIQSTEDRQRFAEHFIAAKALLAP